MRTLLVGHDSPLDRLRSRTRKSVAESTPKRTRSSRKKTPPLSYAEEVLLNQILLKPMDYIDSDEFRKPKAEKKIYNLEEIERPDVSWYRPLMDDLLPSRNRGDRGRTGKSVILSGDQERVLFLKFNYARFRIREIQDTLGNVRPTLEQAREILIWHDIADKHRKQVAETNLALVLAMAKRTRMSEIDFADLVSEGNMALLRSVDKFDCGRGFKFSTYACRAILKAFSRQGMKFTRYRQRFPTDFDPALEKSNYLEILREQHVADSAAEVRHVVLNNEADLSEIEQTVIHHRFGIDSKKPNPANLTLEQVGQIIGVTKERVRQIQNKALEKIREALSDVQPDAPSLSDN